MSEATLKRLLKELRDSQRNEAEYVEDLHPVDDDNLFEWIAVVRGPVDTPYDGGRFEISIKVPVSYPLAPPTMNFVTTVCHPNVQFKTGEICLDLLKTAWSPAWTLQSACSAVAMLLGQPEPDSPLNVDAANILRCGDTRAYRSLVRMYVELHAMGSSNDE
ncbi:ubiquitin-conjugating enzyme [Gonapodya prolifera JEL478]|uniref:Ubiquitin-conjugating enzyme n=1 Tax=Gonapodya prolifera (strain JEL478) TaxID=1344416 RepID=A0A139AIX3_GONPJ|nr:ubiquitin-conjugating enzyme [Gonapodya prolifera JEL478]|eukprot:KXS16752.1 ubiquitin-conjugating enzyme [Gonapodya prolifera JEL478]